VVEAQHSAAGWCAAVNVVQPEMGYPLQPVLLLGAGSAAMHCLQCFHHGAAQSACLLVILRVRHGMTLPGTYGCGGIHMHVVRRQQAACKCAPAPATQHPCPSWISSGGHPSSLSCSLVPVLPCRLGPCGPPSSSLLGLAAGLMRQLLCNSTRLPPLQGSICQCAYRMCLHSPGMWQHVLWLPHCRMIL
jgi:hypothetical protein